MTDTLEVVTGSVTSGITTDAILDPPYGPPGFRVTWIDWDSALRDSSLALGDLIIALDGVILADRLRPGQFGIEIGQANDSTGWERRGAAAGQEIRLIVRRGDTEHEVTGRLTAEKLYRSAAAQSALGPGGPPKLVNDGFDKPWSMWDEGMVRTLSIVLADAWRWPSLNTRQTLTELRAETGRVDLLTGRYPGPYAATMRADWERAMACLEGEAPAAPDLSYREAGAKRRAVVIEEAKRAWEALQASPQLVSGFPAVDLEDRAELAGKLVLLPPVTERTWVTDLGRSYAAATQGGSAYFVLLNSQKFNRFYAARNRFLGAVSSDLYDTWQFAGAVEPDPVLITVGGTPTAGLIVDPAVVRAGRDGELVVDVREVRPNGVSPFAGEALLEVAPREPLPAEATPIAVVEAMIAAVKAGDEATWRGLFATWQAGTYDGRALYRPVEAPTDHQLDEAWADAREKIAKDIYDVRVRGQDPVWTPIPAQPADGLPQVEQTVVWADPIGLFDGEYCPFNNSWVNRRWVLQRVDGGPWKIASLQSL